MNQPEKIRAKTLRKHSNYFKRLYKEVVKKVRRCKMPRDHKQAIISDLQECNNIDIMHYLTVAKFKNKKEFVFHVDNWLLLESYAYKYEVVMKYEVGMFRYLTEKIIKHHLREDRFNIVEKMIFNISEG